jgi:hypothetical protein
VKRHKKQEQAMNTKRMAIIRTVLAAALMLMAMHGRAQESQGQSQAQAPAATGPSAGSSSAHSSMRGMDMSAMHEDANGPEATSANNAMSGHHMEMGAHMFMTELRPENAADEKRAEDIVEALRPAIAKYKDYNVALADGFKIFHPEIPQDIYHFTNFGNAFAAQVKFDPAKPTSLLYKKTATGYELEGAMYTAPRRATEDQLNERVPLSVARWHKHVNFCMPPRGTPMDPVNRKTFGPDGSIVTEEACNAVGGRWIPQVFGWMVHVYPYESDPEKIWAH